MGAGGSLSGMGGDDEANAKLRSIEWSNLEASTTELVTCLSNVSWAREEVSGVHFVRDVS